MKKGIIATMIGIFVWGSFVLVPLQAHAQLITNDPSLAVFETKKIIDNTQKEVKDRIGKALLATGLSGLMNAASYFMRKLAYDTAKYVASGGKGQSALVFQDGFAPYLRNTADTAVGEIIAEFGDLTGLNLCQVPDPQFNLFLSIGIRNLYADGAAGGGGGGPSAEGCSWTSLRNSWTRDAFQERFERYGDQVDQTLDQYITGEFLRTNTVEQSDFGIAFGAIAQVDRLVAEKRQAAMLDRLEGEGFKAVTDLISGDVRTPAAIVQEETTAATAKGNTDLSTKQIAGIYGAGSLQILPQAASVFLNTLTSDLLQQLLTDGLVPSRGGAEGSTTDPFSGLVRNNRQQAEQAFNFLFTSVPNRQLNSYEDDFINQLATCPENPGVYNCVIDSGFQQLLDRARIGQPLTIKEALETRPALLNADWALIPPDREQQNQDKNCYQQKAYCHGNIQKLRKARILPLGFEIAATLGDPDNPETVTLGEVVNGYYQCDYSTGEGRRTPEYPYCNLIDPNWIIKMPEAICEAEVYSPILVSPEGSERQMECADLSTCVAYDEQGTCISYGYCLQEENTWRMPGQSCPAEYATCRSYIQQSNGAAVSYLSRTVDFGMCGPDNVGCLAYSIMKDGDTWVGTPNVSSTLKATTGLNQIVHLNRNINNPAFTCSPDDAGCTAFRVANIVLDGDTVTSSYPSDRPNIALQKAPDYLTCYDSDLNINNGIQWPETVAEAVTAYTSDATCENYAPGCVAAEVGCKLWQPVSGGSSVASIPAKIGNNSCSLECVGYDTFRQRETVFEPAIDAMHFIPDIAIEQGGACLSQYEGCSEFTNIEDAARGGEGTQYFTELRYCEVPTGGNQKTFYSWEGSEVEGFVLRVHQLAQYTSADNIVGGDLVYYQGVFEDDLLEEELFTVGAPKYAARTQAALQELYDRCNENAYNLRIADPFAEGAADLTCREFYDDAGNVFYRNIDQIVSVSEQCQDFRKTDTVLAVDTEITNAGVCSDRGGLWADSQTDEFDDTAVCNVCRGGGIYQGGSCVYSTIPSESVSCPASQNQCRSYVGNTGENTARTQLGDFESETVEGWSGGSISTESPFANQYSLRITDSATIEVGAGELTANTTEAAYELHFWARGIPQRITTNLGSESFGTVAIGDVWRRYTLGPISADTLDLSVTNTLSIGVTPDGPSGQFFIDNIEIVRTSAYTYLKKNSWQQVVTVDGVPVTVDAPLACDSTPLDAFPGEALGCELYQDVNNPELTQAVTTFESLCREEAIGCTAVYDTYNTVDDGNSSASLREQWFNVQCDATDTYTVGGIDIVRVEGNTCSIIDVGQNLFAPAPTTTLGTCTIRSGDDYCYIDRIVVPDHQFNYQITSGSFTNAYTDIYNDVVVDSTVVIPADTPEDSPIFIANQREFQCRDLGCTELGQELQIAADPTDPASYEYNTVYHRLNPASFVGVSGSDTAVLCTSDGVGCDAFQSDRNVQYFKDPTITGNSLCEYRDDVQMPDGEVRSGWFRAGENEPVPCYDDYITLDDEYGIWSNETEDEYLGFVGVCEPQYNACTEFVDRADTSRNNADGTRYYALFNDQLTARVDECDGQAGLKDGCVILDQTDRPNKVYNTAATYRASEQNTNASTGGRYGLVDPITVATSDGSVDANIILKVDRDRQCAEWLECRLSRPEVDENGQTQDVCIMYDTCLEADPSGGCAVWNDNIGTGYCSNDVTDSCNEDSDCLQGACIYQNTLTINQYTNNRDTSWYGRDYSGYSVLNMRSYTNMEPIVFDQDPFSQYLAYIIPERTIESSDFPDRTCSETNVTTELEACGISNEGVCYTGKCIVPISGSFSGIEVARDVIGTTSTSIGPDGAFTREDRLHVSNTPKYAAVMSQLVTSACKAYPEADAPYPASILLATPESPRELAGANIFRYPFEIAGANNRRSNFVRANIFQDPALGDMTGSTMYADGANPFISSCVYSKLTYQNGITDYTPINQPRFEGICPANAPGENPGRPCETGDTCGAAPNAGITCSPLEEIQTRIGFEGFCLQYDLSRPINGLTEPQEYACLVWLPMQVSASRIDVYNNSIEAGYYPVPQYDAPLSDGVGGGVLYCAESTNFGQGLATDAFDIDIAGVPSLEEAYENLGTTLRIGRTGVPYKPSRDGGDRYTIEDMYDVTVDYNEYNFFSWCLTPARELLENNIQNIASDLASVDLSGCDDIYADEDAIYTQEEAEVAYCAPSITVSVAGFDDQTFDTCPASLDALVADINSTVDEYRDDEDPITSAFLLYYDISGGDLSTGVGCDNSYFATDGYPRLACATENRIVNRGDRIGDERRRCANFNNRTKVRAGVYQELVCDNIDSSPGSYANYEDGMYSLIQTWAWDVANLGNSAHILRVEYAGTNNTERTDEYGVQSGRQFAMYPTKLMDRVYRYSHESIRLFEPLEEGYISESGHRQVYSTGLEQELHEDMIDIVYAIPLRYPHGYDSNAPALLDTSFRIDFDNPFLSIASVPSVRSYEVRSQPAETDLEFPSKSNSGGSLTTYRYTLDAGDTRYVTVYHDPTIVLHVPGSDGESISTANDPFGTLDCSGDDEEWFAFAMDFDTDGNFLGYASAVCEGSGSARFGVQLAIVATLKDACMEYDLVYDETQFGATTNKAYTNRVWKDAEDTLLSGTQIRHTTLLQPFGSLYEQTVPDEDSRYIFEINTDGSPLWCGTNRVFTLTDFVPQFATACTGLPDGTPRIAADGAAQLNTIFARINDSDAAVVSNPTGFIPPQIYATNPATCASRSSGAIAAEVAVGTIAGNDITSISDLGGCSPGPANTFTINGKTGRADIDFNGDSELRDEDRDLDGVWDGLMGYGAYPVTLQFFAFADHDRMPIRTVKIDFNDGSPVVGGEKMGYFKNAKPYCAQTIGECGDTQLTCNTNDDCTAAGLTGTNAICGTAETNFGNQARACTTNYFEYNYVYRCYEGDESVDTVPVRELPDHLRQKALRYPNVTDTTEVCAYKPRVQVTDNWGWCNATDALTDFRRNNGANGNILCDNRNNPDVWTSFGSRVQEDDLRIYVVPRVTN